MTTTMMMVIMKNWIIKKIVYMFGLTGELWIRKSLVMNPKLSSKVQSEPSFTLYFACEQEGLWRDYDDEFT